MVNTITLCHILVMFFCYFSMKEMITVSVYVIIYFETKPTMVIVAFWFLV